MMEKHPDLATELDTQLLANDRLRQRIAKLETLLKWFVTAQKEELGDWIESVPDSPIAIKVKAAEKLLVGGE